MRNQQGENNLFYYYTFKSKKIKFHGYPLELHSVKTEDGYILEMHRIPDSPHAPNRTRKRPVIIMHGLLDSSSGFLLMDKDDCLPFLLADLGYDV